MGLRPFNVRIVTVACWGGGGGSNCATDQNVQFKWSVDYTAATLNQQIRIVRTSTRHRRMRSAGLGLRCVRIT